MKVNPAVLKFFETNYRPGAIGLIGGVDLVSQAIREAEAPLTLDGKPSQWSHSFILGDKRTDRNNPDGSGSIWRSIYVLESTISLDPFALQVRNGAQENWIGHWAGYGIENAAVIDFDLTNEETYTVLGTALQLVDDQIKYPVIGLFGVWYAMIASRMWAPNPIKDIHAMLCSQYARYCYREAKRDFLGTEVDLSNTSPESIFQAGKKSGKVVGFIA